MEGASNKDSFREKKEELSDDESDFSEDSYQSMSLDGSEGDILEVDSDNGEAEDGEVIGADSSSGEEERVKVNEAVVKKAQAKKNSLWSDVVTEQVLTSSLGHLNKKPIILGNSTTKKLAKSKRKRNGNTEEDDIPSKLKNYHDFDAENDLLTAGSSITGRPSSSNGNNRVDFNALVKAVEKGRVEKEKVASKPKARKPVLTRLGPVTRSSSSNNQKSGATNRKRPPAISRLDIDERVVVDESLDNEQLVNALSRALGEEQSLETLINAVNVLGTARCVEFFKRTVVKEKNGGITVVDGSRRKTPGGVFFYLIKTSADVTAAERIGVFGSNSDLKAKKKRSHKHGSHKSAKKSRTASNSIGSYESASNSVTPIEMEASSRGNSNEIAMEGQ